MDRTKNYKSKDILQINEPSINLPELKIRDYDEHSDIKESNFVGDVIPFISYNNKYTFNYKQINSFSLQYDGLFPYLYFSINDTNNEFTALSLPTEGDYVSLFLKSNNEEFNDIYIQFDILSFTNFEGFYSFECIMNVPEIFNEICKCYPEKTSYDLFNEVSEELKLGFCTNISSTDDSMNWINPMESTLNFLKEEIKHSYKDDLSFFIFFIDFFYNLNFIELNNQFGKKEREDTFLNLIKSQAKNNFSDGEEVKIEGTLWLTNLHGFRGTNSYIYDYNLLSSSGEVKLKNGLKRKAQFYDNELKSYETHDIEPTYEEESDNVKTFKNDDITLEKFKYFGTQQTQEDTKNVHDNYYFAEIQNHQNIQEINKLKLKVYLAKANFHLYRFQSIPVALFEYDSQNIDKLGVKNGLTVEDEKPNITLLEHYSGYFVIDNIKYVYDSKDNKIGQELILTRREWPNVIKE